MTNLGRMSRITSIASLGALLLTGASLLILHRSNVSLPDRRVQVSLVDISDVHLNAFFDDIQPNPAIAKMIASFPRNRPECVSTPGGLSKISNFLGLDTVVHAQSCTPGGCTGCYQDVVPFTCGGACEGSQYSGVVPGTQFDGGINTDGSTACSGCDCTFTTCTNMFCG